MPPGTRPESLSLSQTLRLWLPCLSLPLQASWRWTASPRSQILLGWTPPSLKGCTLPTSTRHCLTVTVGSAHRRSTCGRVEVLDESSSWRGPRVIMVDCIHQPNDCMPTTDSHGVCCNNEREDSWISSKRRVAAPQASARNSFLSCKRPRRRTASHIIGNMDSLLFLDNVLGLPTVRWALHAPTQIQREHRPASTIQELLANAEACHKRLISRARLLKIAG